MVENRKNINSAVGEVNKLYSAMSDIIDEQKEEMISQCDYILQASHNNLLLNAKHMSIDLGLCSTRRVFDCQHPVLLTHIEDNISCASGSENSADLIEIIPGKEITTIQNLSTDNLEV